MLYLFRWTDLRQDFKKMPTDLFQVHFVCFTDEPDGIRQQDAAFCFLRFVLLPLFIFLVRDLFHCGYPDKPEFVRLTSGISFIHSLIIFS